MKRSQASAIMTALIVTCMIVIVTSRSLRAEDVKLTPELSGTIEGFVKDSQHKPLAEVRVSIQSLQGTAHAIAPNVQATLTDSGGSYRFARLPIGLYRLQASKAGYLEAASPAIKVSVDKVIAPDLLMTVSTASANAVPPADANTPSSAKQSTARAPELYDEPQFTVAGVTQAGAGGHGSDVTTRGTEALARQTITLGNKTLTDESGSNNSVPTEGSLRALLVQHPDDFEANRQLGYWLLTQEKAADAKPFLLKAVRLHPQDAETHHLLARTDERLNDSLGAVREDQRAAEIDPSEPHLFDWGTELLSHNALEPATEVFARGNRLFPKSDRMLIALGIAYYSRGFYDRAAQSVLSACDLDVTNPDPYLFLGRMQELHASPLTGASDRLARLVRLQPQNARSIYYYAIALRREADNSKNNDSHAEPAAADYRPQVEALLEQAAKLDPTFAPAHLQLGVVFSTRGDLAQAIAEYKKVVENPSADIDTRSDALYRLAAAHLRLGNKLEAEREFELHRQLKKQAEDDASRQQKNLQQFVISLRRDNKQNPAVP